MVNNTTDYKWFKNSKQIATTTIPSHSIIGLNNEGQYHVKASYNTVYIPSNNVSISVNYDGYNFDKVILNTIDDKHTFEINKEPITFVASYTFKSPNYPAIPLTYRWYHNGQLQAKTANNTYTVNALNETSGKWHVEVETNYTKQGVAIGKSDPLDIKCVSNEFKVEWSDEYTSTSVLYTEHDYTLSCNIIPVQNNAKPTSIKWFKNNAIIAGANSTSLNINEQISNTYNFKVEVTIGDNTKSLNKQLPIRDTYKIYDLSVTPESYYGSTFDVARTLDIIYTFTVHAPYYLKLYQDNTLLYTSEWQYEHGDNITYTHTIAATNDEANNGKYKLEIATEKASSYAISNVVIKDQAADVYFDIYNKNGTTRTDYRCRVRAVTPNSNGDIYTALTLSPVEYNINSNNIYKNVNTLMKDGLTICNLKVYLQDDGYLSLVPTTVKDDEGKTFPDEIDEYFQLPLFTTAGKLITNMSGNPYMIKVLPYTTSDNYIAIDLVAGG